MYGPDIRACSGCIIMHNYSDSKTVLAICCLLLLCIIYDGIDDTFSYLPSTYLCLRYKAFFCGFLVRTLEPRDMLGTYYGGYSSSYTCNYGTYSASGACGLYLGIRGKGIPCNYPLALIPIDAEPGCTRIHNPQRCNHHEIYP